MANSASLVIPNDLDELTRVGEWISAWAKQNALPDLMSGQIDLCAAEAVTNVISYAHEDSQAHEVFLQMDREGDAIRLRIEDDGMAFDPTRATIPTPVTLQNERIGGWGISIMRRLSSEMHYSRLDERNRLTLVFRQQQQVNA